MVSGCHNGPYFNYSYEPLVNPNSTEPLSGSELFSPGSTQCVPGSQLSSGILTLPGLSGPPSEPPHPRRPRPTCVSMVTGPAPNQKDGFQAALDHWLGLEFSLLQGEPHCGCHMYLFYLHDYFESLMRSRIYVKSIVLRSAL